MKFSFNLFLFNCVIDPSIQMSVLPYSFNCLQTIPGIYVAILGLSSVLIKMTVYVSVTVWALRLRAHFILERESQR
jgi:hypothetical protein